MFSLSRTQQLEKKLAEIDLQLLVTQPYQYRLREALKEDKRRLLRELEQDQGNKKIVSSPSSISYNPIELYIGYPEAHEDRKSFRTNKEQAIRLQIKEKQNLVRQLCDEIDSLKCAIKIIQTEKEQSSDEELRKHFDRAMKAPQEEKARRRSMSPPSSPEPQLALLSGPKVFLSAQFLP